MENDILNLIYGLVSVLLTAFAGFLTHKVLPTIKNRYDIQNGNRKYQKFIHFMNIGMIFAKNVVVPMAQRKDLTNPQRLQFAIQYVHDKLLKVGIDLPESTIKGIVERAYQDYKASGGDVHKFTANVKNDVNSQLNSGQNIQNQNGNSNGQYGNEFTNSVGQKPPFSPNGQGNQR